MKKTKKINLKKIYVVAAGKIPGFYQSWEKCQEQTKGFSGAKFQSFTNLEEALEYAKFII